MTEHEIWLQDLYDNPRYQRDFAAINEIDKLREKVAELEKQLAAKAKKATTK